jgi:hypothetical protein
MMEPDLVAVRGMRFDHQLRVIVLCILSEVFVGVGGIKPSSVHDTQH